MSTIAAAAATVWLCTGAQAAEPRLGLPVQCEPGETCWVVNYFDHDPGDGVRDYHCGALGYDGHDGTDFAIRDRIAMIASIPVVAAAPGTVKAVRDGMADTGLHGGEPGAVSGRECGNGVLIAHEDGWQTQYCHMRRGSVAVRPGDRVERGQRLGFVGLSGHTEFPHLHLTVRHNGKEVDPFLGAEAFGSCRMGAGTLWNAEARRALAYRPIAIYNAGFSGDAPDPDRIRQGERRPPATDAPALVLWADIFGVEAGDRISLRILSPAGETVVANTRAIDKRAIRRFEFAGKRTPPGAWPAGVYTGEIVVMRGGERNLTVRHQTKLDLR